ncbi:pilus assembly protein [Acidovorax sp. DW039]|uniref:pilus assembly protein n=1 Tax=Acidovorax sp. DW039 TaxID=3095606 RepID=UPI003086504D|nr:pilus assembly protein [Acidovorax sp. DW039]
MSRFKFAARYAAIHFLISCFLASCAALIVLVIWYPAPYDLLSGGRGIFILMLLIDIICGPLLTLLLANPNKRRVALRVDMGLIAVIQLSALFLGFWTSYQARPLFLVHEIDRFRVITLSELSSSEDERDFRKLPLSLRPVFWRGPSVVGIRSPLNPEERGKVLFESLMGRADYAQRIEFYIPYDDVYRKKVLERAKSVMTLLAVYPHLEVSIKKMAHQSNLAVSELLFLPVIHRQDWIAIMDSSARILGFLPGDGFLSQ